MARTRDRLTARFVATIKAKGRYADGAGLYLLVDDDGNRRWLYRYTMQKRTRDMGLGSAADVTLSAARERAAAMRDKVRRGVDPIDSRGADIERPRSRTFREHAEQYITTHEASWKNDKHVAQWRMTLLEKAAALGPRAVDTIDTEAVLEVLKPIWLELPETAGRLRGRIERVLDAARIAGERSGENPARWRGHLDHLLPRRKKSRRHHAALPYVEAATFVARLRERDSISARALEWTILTGARTTETTDAVWGEISRDQRIWTVPAGRMKGDREHRVPLSVPAMAILEVMWPLAEAATMGRRATSTMPVFPGARPGRGLSNAAMAECLKEFELASPATVHGFRSTFRDWVGDQTRFEREIAEAALAHKTGDDTELAYRRSDALERRRRLMDAWAAYLDAAPSAKVVRLR